MSRQSARTRRPAFTLIEVLMVLVILVILGSFAVTIFTGTQDKARIDQAKAQIGLIEPAARLYQLHMNDYPRTLDDLVVQPSDVPNPAKWGGPYMERIPLDPWEGQYLYAYPGKQNPQKFDVWSAGPDRMDGTDDDIGNWEQ
ncbi:MAG: type II secretion system protein GspG [Planctomycetes bacterium RBG_16_64_10]|nr:MAG: type II secretion system protein GspG [Planctomycetes bacterium RBG_16_64_10]